jgi:hypothetical protein
MGIRVRRATAADVDWIVAELKVFARSYGTKKPIFPDEGYARKGMLNMIEEHVVLVAEKGSALVGFIAAFVAPHVFNPDVTAMYQSFWWVQPEHRRSRAAAMLLDRLVKWAELNVDQLIFGVQTQTNVSERAFLRRGFRPYERSYFREFSR